MPNEIKCGSSAPPEGIVVVDLPADAMIWRDGEFATRVGIGAHLHLPTREQANDVLVSITNQVLAISNQSAAESGNPKGTIK